MAKLNTVRNGWRLDSVLSVKVDGPSFSTGKLPVFVPSVVGGDQTVTTPGGWRGGEKWQSSTVPGPWGLPGVI